MAKTKALQPSVDHIVWVPVDDIQVQHNVREIWDEEDLQRLAESVGALGILEPLIVRAVDDGVILVAGERRLRAAKMAGLDQVPVIVRDLTEGEAAKLQILENLQRKQLNAVEQARGFERLISEYGMMAKDLAEQLGVSPSLISNRRRLLELPSEVLEDVSHEKLSASVAVALVPWADNPELVKELATSMVERGTTQAQVRSHIGQEVYNKLPLVGDSAYYRPDSTVDPEAHVRCPCRREVEVWGKTTAVCTEPELFKAKEAEIKPMIEAKKEVAKFEALAAAESGEAPIDVAALKWEREDYRAIGIHWGDGRERPSCAHDNCPCVREAKLPYHEGETSLICIDPKAFDVFREEQRAKEREEEARRLEDQMAEIHAWAKERLYKCITPDRHFAVFGRVELAFLAAHLLCNLSPRGHWDGNKMVHHPDRLRYLKSLLGNKGWDKVEEILNETPWWGETDVQNALADRLLTADAQSLTQIVIEWPLLAVNDDHLSEGGESPAEWYRRQADGNVTPRPDFSQVFPRSVAEEPPAEVEASWQ